MLRKKASSEVATHYTTPEGWPSRYPCAEPYQLGRYQATMGSSFGLVGLVGCSDVLMFACSNVRIFGCSDVQMFRSHFQVPLFLHPGNEVEDFRENLDHFANCNIRYQD